MTTDHIRIAKSGKLNPAVKEAWVKALRSGKYPQTQARLRRETPVMRDGIAIHGIGFCCFGVLCDIRDPSKWIHTSPRGTKGYGDEFSTHMPPPDVLEWAGFPGEDLPKVTIQGTTTTLDVHNDQGKTFTQIADAIEAQL